MLRKTPSTVVFHAFIELIRTVWVILIRWPGRNERCLAHPLEREREGHVVVDRQPWHEARLLEGKANPSVSGSRLSRS